MVFTAEMLCVGNELLIGKTTNTNLTWLSGQLSHLGCYVHRAVIVRDAVAEIANALQLLLQARPDLLIITGGLGPTFDDKTLQGIAQALQTFLHLDRTALKLVIEKVGELNPARLKMAHIPESSHPLRNPIGTAPGVYTIANGVHVFALPGVPSEMRSIFKKSIAGFLREKFEIGHLYEASVLSLGVPESTISPFIDEAMRRFPDVYVKSHPLGLEEGGQKINLHLTSRQSHRFVRKAADMLTKQIRRIGGKVRTH